MSVKARHCGTVQLGHLIVGILSFWLLRKAGLSLLAAGALTAFLAAAVMFAIAWRPESSFRTYDGSWAFEDTAVAMLLLFFLFVPTSVPKDGAEALIALLSMAVAILALLVGALFWLLMHVLTIEAQRESKVFWTSQPSWKAYVGFNPLGLRSLALAGALVFRVCYKPREQSSDL